MRILLCLALLASAACRAVDSRPVEAPKRPEPARAEAPPDGKEVYYQRDWARVPVGYRSCRFKQTHTLNDCLGELKEPTLSHADGVLFVDESTTAAFHVVHADRFHLHLVQPDGRDEVVVPDEDGQVELPPRATWPSRVVLATTGFFLDGNGRRLFVPPYTITYRLEPLATMEAQLAIQDFAIHVADERGAQPHTALAALPRNATEFSFAYYNLTRDRKNAETAAFLCGPGHLIPEPTYRAVVRGKNGVTFQKVEILPYPPDTAPAPQGSEFFNFEQDGRQVDRVPVPPRPVLSHPDTTKQPLPFVNVAANFYGFAKGRWQFIAAYGYPGADEGSLIRVESKEIDGSTRTVSTTVSPDKNARGDSVARTAFYEPRLSRTWATKGGFLPARDIRVAVAGEHEHKMYVATEKLPHATLLNLAGVGAAEDDTFGPFARTALNDAAVLAALSGDALLDGPTIINPAGAGGSADKVNVTVINNHGGGGGSSGAGEFLPWLGGADLAGTAPPLVEGATATALLPGALQRRARPVVKAPQDPNSMPGYMYPMFGYRWIKRPNEPPFVQ